MIKVVTPIDERPATKAGSGLCRAGLRSRARRKEASDKPRKSSTTSRWLPSYVEPLSCLELMKVRGGDPQEGRRRDALMRFALTHTPSRR
jgi:hypothetical protein